MARRVEPAFWEDKGVREAVSAWELGQVVRLFRQHTGASQAAVARLVSIDQAEVSRLERGRKKIRDRRQLIRWAEALGIPEELRGPLPTAEPSVQSAERKARQQGSVTHVLDSLPSEGSGCLLFPPGRSFPATPLPILAVRSVSLGARRLRLAPGGDMTAWSGVLMRALISSSALSNGLRKQFVIDAGQARRHIREGGPVDIPTAYELDDLTYGILWAAAGFDASFVTDEGLLHRIRSPLLRSDPERLHCALEVPGLTDGSRMLLSSEACAGYIVDRRHHSTDGVVFWTREKYGEEAATWLLFAHKLHYLQQTAPAVPHSGGGRAFCVPEAAVAASPRYERVLLFLAMALMESFGITTWLSVDAGYEQCEGFALEPGHKAIIATWVRADDGVKMAYTSRPGVLRGFAEVSGSASQHSVTAGSRPWQRLVATADYLRLDHLWLARRCRQLASEGTHGLAAPRSRHLSVEGLDRACGFAAKCLAHAGASSRSMYR
ncbi:helix-turn-helix domain-containing protein [Streptomyces platensis]|uniref:helix-turn-helix domain-containing protein n=1 Tax=Streptomyces platensis TaxID=58346 RepID=UPI00386BEDA6|nr:helix-turn-helix domain-containing protein [Streptomyces platensis]